MLRSILPLLFALALAAGCGGGGGEPPADGDGPPTGFRITTASLPTATVGERYAIILEAAGGTGVGCSWRIVSGALPTGLALDGDPSCLAWGAFETAGTIAPDEDTGARTEISGLAASRRTPGVLWAHDDSGGDAVLYALAEDGLLLQSYTLDAKPTDWEDLSIGPGPDPDKAYLYIGDIGDNGSRRAHVTLLRVEEPDIPSLPGAPIALPHDAFSLRYPDGAHDAEALLADGTSGALYVIEKNDAGGNVFRTPLPLDAAWTPTAPGVFVQVTTNRPLPPSVTAADADPSGRRVVFRTYTLGYEVTGAIGASFDDLFAAEPCTFVVPFLGQYESLTLTPDGTGLFTTTELVLGPTIPLLRSTAASSPPTASIAGTSAARGAWAFTVEVRDSAGATAVRELVLQVR